MGTFQVSFGFLHYIVFTSFQQGLSIDLNHVYSTRFIDRLKSCLFDYELYIISNYFQIHMSVFNIFTSFFLKFFC